MMEDGSGFKYLCLYELFFFLRIKREEYKQEFFRQMAFSNLSMRLWLLVNKDCSGEQALTERVSQTWGREVLLHNVGEALNCSSQLSLEAL